MCPSASTAPGWLRPWVWWRDLATRSGLLEEGFAPAQAGGDADDLGKLPPGRRVGGEEAGGAGQDQRAFLRSLRPRVELANGRLVGLEPVKLGVLGEEGVAEGLDGGGRIAAFGEVAVDDGARFV